jgi:hypothetical protein
LALLLALSGCGPFIERGFIEPKAKNCTELATQDFLDQVSPAEGKAALEDCRDDVKDKESFADSVRVSEIAVDGARAEAMAGIEGGTSDGQRATLGLVKEGAQWKVDSLEDLEIDPKRFKAAFRATVEREETPLSKKQIDCIVEELGGRLPVLEASLVRGDFDPVLNSIVDCLGDGDPRAAVEAITRRGLTKAGLTNAQASCVVRRLRDDINVRDAELILTGVPSKGFEAAVGVETSKCVLGSDIPVKPPQPDNAPS